MSLRALRPSLRRDSKKNLYSRKTICRRRLDFKPLLEALEDRRLLAGDLDEALSWISCETTTEETDDTGAAVTTAMVHVVSAERPTFLHNESDPEDVNGDGECSPIDAVLLINELAGESAALSVHYVDVNGDGDRSPIDALLVITRINTQPEMVAGRRPGTPPTPTPPTNPVPAEFRTIDGTGNNLTNLEWGSTNEQLLRKAAAEYGDGIYTPAGADRPSARAISNAIVAHADEATPSERDLTAYIYVFGQFLDHDMDLTQSATPAQAFNIAVPKGDPQFDPAGTGTQVISLKRSNFDTATGASAANPRQQLNEITAWIDGSMVYGSSAETAASLRTLSGGKLLTSAGNLPPVDADGNYLAGDIRANENIELTSMHTLFVREHNRLATEIAAANPALGDEAIYQQARAIVIAEIQAITYKEFLPALLGNALPAYRGYNASVNPQIANEFSTAAFRLHTLINDDVEFFDNAGRPITFDYVDTSGETVTVEGEIALKDAFFNPNLFKQTGVDGMLKYAASTHAEEADTQLVDSLRNFLFGQPGQGGLDLASLNIQRGRDHGLADYNAVREAYGLPRVTSFSQITTDTELATQLEKLYGSVDNIDLWAGGLAEDHARGALGPLFSRIIAEQFQRLRDGDRFWYERVFSGNQLERLQRTTLADIIERNTGVKGLQDNIFFFRAEASGTVFTDANGNGRQDRNEAGLPGATVELVNDEGEVIETAVSSRGGNYRLTDFPETGDFVVRMVTPTGQTLTTAGEREILVSAGDVSLRGLNFGLRATPATPTTPTPPPTPTPPTTPSSGSFDIQFRFSGLTASQQAIFEQAAAEWEAVIVGDLPDAVFNGQVVDDLLIQASAVAIDGRGSVLGQAAPDRFRGGSQLPYHGVMQFDTADIAQMQASGTLLGVIMHEMGHVLGIGTLWSSKGLIVGANTNNPRYVGQQALSEYIALAGVSATGIPVENTGGGGTRNAHWRESVFGSELMTGFVGSASNMPLSRMTVAALADLGYVVNLLAADAYALPASTSASVQATDLLFSGELSGLLT